MRLAHLVLMPLAAAALAGCAAVSALGRAAEVRDVHDLRAPATAPAPPRSGNAHLVIELPVAGGAIDTDAILVRPGPTMIAYLPDASWSAPVPEMLQTAMVDMFLRGGGYAFVGRRPLGASGDYALVSTLIDFGAEVVPGTDSGRVTVALAATIVRERDAAVIAGRTFRASAGIADTSTPAILAGFHVATDAMLGELAEWVYRSTL